VTVQVTAMAPSRGGIAVGAVVVRGKRSRIAHKLDRPAPLSH
jgi:hypothetical protein